MIGQVRVFSVVLLLLIVLRSSLSVGAQSTITVISSSKMYKVQSTGHLELVATLPVPASFECSTCSPFQARSLYIPQYGYVFLASAALIMVQNLTATYLSLPPECPANHLLNAGGGNFYVACKSTVARSWTPRYQPVKLTPAGYSLDEQLQYVPTGTINAPVENNSAFVRDGEGGLYLVYIDGTNLWSRDMASLMPSLIPGPDCANLSSVGPLQPLDGRFRFAVECTGTQAQGGVYIVDQVGGATKVPPALFCGSLVAVPGGRYALVFCSPSTLYIVDLTSGTKSYAIRNGIAMGDQLLFLPNLQLVIIIALNKDIVVVDLPKEYQTEGAGRTVLPNTASTSLRPNVLSDDGTLTTCSTNGIKNWCQTYNLTNAALLASYNLDTIRPDAIIVEQRPDAMPSTWNTTTAPSATTAALRNPKPAISSNGIVAAVVASAVALVLVLATVATLAITYYAVTRKKVLTTPTEATSEEGIRSPALGQSTNNSANSSTSNLSSRSDSCDGNTIPPSLPRNQSLTPSPPPPASVMVIGTDHHQSQ